MSKSYVAVVKDPFSRLEDASVFTGSSLEEVLADLVEMEWVTADQVAELTFKDGTCVVPVDGGMDVVVFEP